MTHFLGLVTILLSLASPSQEKGWTKEACKGFMLEVLDSGQIPLDVPAYVDCKYDGFALRMQILASSANLQLKGSRAPGIIRALSRGDNIRVYGEFKGPAGKAGGTFYVYDLDRQPPDEQEFEKRRATLQEGDVQERLALGDWAKHKYDLYGSWSLPLQKKYLEMFEQAVAILEKEAGENDYENHLEIAQILLHRMVDRQRALDKLSLTCLRIRPDEPDLLLFLSEEVRAILHRGDWVLYEKFKEAEGFVRRTSEGPWIPEPIAILEDFALKVDGIRPPMRQPRIFDDQAERGEIAEGMGIYHIVKAIGYPVDILRLPKGADVLEIWAYPKRYILFKGTTAYRIEKRR